MPPRAPVVLDVPSGAASAQGPEGVGYDVPTGAAARALFSGDAPVPVTSRLLAWGIDLAVLFSVPLIAVLAGTASFGKPGLSWLDNLIHAATHHPSVGIAAGALLLLTSFVYLTLALAFGGRTLGDRLAGLRSIDEARNAPPDLPTSALRSALAILGTFAFLAGPLWALVDPRGQALHDKVVGTRTIRC